MPAEDVLSPEPGPLATHASHTLRDAGGVEYALNRAGYRCEEFYPRGEYNVLTFGCGRTFGCGVAYRDTWAERLCQRLARSHQCRVSNWNVAWPGATND